jgi:hypothetical protein
MVGLINGSVRNKTEELLQAEKIISDLKYIQACTTLMAYACSIVYASKFLGLFSLNEFRALMMNFFGTENAPINPTMVDPKIE